MRKENCKTTTNLVFLIQQEENIHKVSVNSPLCNNNKWSKTLNSKNFAYCTFDY
jgi:hypothetical protein